MRNVGDQDWDEDEDEALRGWGEARPFRVGCGSDRVTLLLWQFSCIMRQRCVGWCEAVVAGPVIGSLTLMAPQRCVGQWETSGGLLRVKTSSTVYFLSPPHHCRERNKNEETELRN